MLKVLRSPTSLITLLAGVIGVFIVLYAWRLPPFATSVETTDNAYVRGFVTIMSPQVTGYVVEVPVRDYQAVKQGEMLVKIDERIYAQKLAQAQATLDAQKAALDNSRQQEASAKSNIVSAQAQADSARATLQLAELNWKRTSDLGQRNAVAVSSVEQAQASLSQAQAGVNQADAAIDVARQSLSTIIVNRGSLEAAVAGAEAAVNLAQIDVDNTVIRAPRDGHVGEVGARVGQYVTAGTQLTTVVPSDLWVVANFKETQLDGMKVGQVASFTVDALEHKKLTGRVERFSPATGSEFSVIKPDNATGNFTKIAQRVGVRIAIDPEQADARLLAPGLSVVVSVDKNAPASGGELASGN